MDRFTVKTITEVAEFFGRHRDVIRRDWAGAGMPGQPGGYHLPTIARWLLGRREQHHGLAAERAVEIDEAGNVLASFMARHPALSLKYERARREQIRNAKLAASIILWDEAFLVVSELVEIFRSEAEGLHEEAVIDLPPGPEKVEAAGRIRYRVGLMMERMYEARARFGATHGERPGGPTPSAAGHRPPARRQPRRAKTAGRRARKSPPA